MKIKKLKTFLEYCRNRKSYFNDPTGADLAKPARATVDELYFFGRISKKTMIIKQKWK